MRTQKDKIKIIEIISSQTINGQPLYKKEYIDLRQNELVCTTVITKEIAKAHKTFCKGGTKVISVGTITPSNFGKKIAKDYKDFWSGGKKVISIEATTPSIFSIEKQRGPFSK